MSCLKRGSKGSKVGWRMGMLIFMFIYYTRWCPSSLAKLVVYKSHFTMVYGRYNELVFMGFINPRSHHWGAPSCTFLYIWGWVKLPMNLHEISGNHPTTILFWYPGARVLPRSHILVNYWLNYWYIYINIVWTQYKSIVLVTRSGDDPQVNLLGQAWCFCGYKHGDDFH